jgi:Amino acid permease
MAESAFVPFTETKAPEAPERLHRGALGLVDIAASTMANIGPAYSFFFGFGLIVITAGIAAPLTIIAAGIAVALLGNTLAQFSRAHPSTGGFITFVGKTFGGTSAVTTALLCGAGYIIAISSVLAVSGWFLEFTLNYYFGWNVPWVIWSVLLTGGAVLMMLRGVGVSTRLAGFFFGFEMLVLLVVSVVALIKNGGHLSAAPFDPHNITSGFRGLGAGFPLAVYLFIGWENSAALAEETGNPRRNVPRAVFLSIALMLTGYVLFAYATVSGFRDNGAKLGAALTTFFDESGTIGALLVLVVYFLANMALPSNYRKYRAAEFNIVKHAIRPVLGMIAIAIAIAVYYLCMPPQSVPYHWFPYMGLGVVIMSVLHALVLTRRDPGIGDGRFDRRRRVAAVSGITRSDSGPPRRRPRARSPSALAAAG